MKVTDNETRWAKIGHIPELAFVGKDVLFFGAGCHLIFVNLQNGEELIYTANNARTGDGVKSYAGNRGQNVFAFAENRTKAAIFIKTYPNFDEIHRLTDGDARGYLEMVFSETSLLVTLGDLPDFVLTVWNWRLGEKIASQEGGVLRANQMLKCNFGSPVFLAQLALETKTLHVWDIYICGKKCVLTQHITHLEQKCENFTSIIWTTEGGLFVLDSTGSVYTVFPDHHLEKVIDFNEPGNHPTSFAWYKSGIAVAGPNNEIRHYKKSGAWSIDWSMVPPEPTQQLVARFEYLVTITENNNILQVLPGQNEFKYVKEKNSQFNDFCLVYPMGQFVMALTHGKCINLYSVATGDLMSSLDLNANATLIVENPKFPYAALGCDNGCVKLVAAYDPQKLVKMTQFLLTKDPIDSIYFNDCGTVFVAASLVVGMFFVIEGLPGGQMKIISTVDAKCQIADQMMIVSQDCYRIFMIPVTSKKYVAGNAILRYCVIKGKGVDVKEYAFEDKHVLCNRIIASIGPSKDRILYVLFCDSKTINEIEIKKGGDTALITNQIVTGHQMRDVHLRLDKKSALTWGYDGLIIARSSDFATNIGICLPHHRFEAGVKKAYIGPHRKYIIALGGDGVLTCTNLMENEIDPELQTELEDIHNSEDYRLLFTNRTSGFVPKGKYEGKCYLEVERLKQIEKERMQCEAEKTLILAEFRSIQTELQDLLTANLEGPDNEKLNLSEFNLNVKLFEKKANHHKKVCKSTEVYLRHLIDAQNKISDYMIANFWEKMRIPGTAIKAIFAKFEVTNYVLRPANANLEEMLEWIRQQRKLESYLNEMNSFRPWEPMTEEKLMNIISSVPRVPVKDKHMAVLSALEDDTSEMYDEEDDQESKIAFSGSDTARFIEIQDIHYFQTELITYFQTELQWSISKSDCYKLKEHFNTKFDRVMQQKLKEMGNIKQRNDRLRHIVSELNHFSDEQIQMRIEDPEWRQIETPEAITKVKDNEVPITPYVSPSEQAILDTKAAEAERLRLLLLADDFRERALMAMMNGVLEVRWEDELRKEVPLPKCMIEKEPENYNEDDLRAVKEYEEKVRFLNSERERYKTLLRAEYGKVANHVRDNIKKFNGKLTELLYLKLLVDAAISQESLKINRTKLYQYKRKMMIQREHKILEKIVQNDEITASLHKLLHTLHDSISECRNYVESFQVKDKFLEKAYKKDFQEMSIVVQEQASKLFKKRPKTNFRLINSPTVLNELAKCILSNAKPPPVLNSDCMEFLKQMDNLDMFLGVPLVVDEHTYALICKHRRLRIEFEIKLRAAQTELAEAEATLAAFQKRLHQKKESSAKLHNDLNGVRDELVNVTCDSEMQIVLARGLVEIPLTGRLTDFDDAVLICRKDVEDINSIILRFGGNKIKALQQGMNFRRRILAVEWEHRRLRMLIQDLQEKIIDIDGVKLTKEIQYYLKTKNKEKAIPFETEVDMIKGSYENTIQDRKDVVNRMRKQMRTIKEHDKAIEQRIKELNVDVCEFNLIKDQELDEKERTVVDTRMKTLLKRSKLVQQVQDNHHEILMLQTELELLRLKTFPTLKYKVV